MTEISSDATINSSEALDPYNPANLRLNPSLSEGVPTKKVIVSIKVDKPNNGFLVRMGSIIRIMSPLCPLRMGRGMNGHAFKQTPMPEDTKQPSPLPKCRSRCGLRCRWHG